MSQNLPSYGFLDIKQNFFCPVSRGMRGLQLGDDGSYTVWCQNKPVEVISLKHEQSLRDQPFPQNTHAECHTLTVSTLCYMYDSF